MGQGSSPAANSGNQPNDQITRGPPQMEDDDELSLFVSDRIFKRDPDEEPLDDWRDIALEVIDLDPDEEPMIKGEPSEPLWPIRGRVIYISDSEDEVPTKRKSPAKNASANGISPNGPVPEPIDLYKDVPIKSEIQDSPRSWKAMPKHIDLSDDEGPNDIKMHNTGPATERIPAQAPGKDDSKVPADGPNDVPIPTTEHEQDVVILNGGAPVIIKEEPKDAEFSWTPMNSILAKRSMHNGRVVIDLDDPIENVVNRGRFKRPALDHERILQLQQMYKQKMLGQRDPRRATCPGAQHTMALSRISDPSLNKDGLEVIQSEVIPDDPDSGEDFERIHNAYRAKKRSHKNSFEDDVEFKRAQMREQARINRKFHETADSDDSDEAAQSDDDLFMPQDTHYQGLAKRAFDARDDDDEEDETLIQALQGNSKGNKKPKKANQAKEINLSDPAERRIRQREYLKEYNRELAYNMMAGIETILARDQDRHNGVVQKEAEKLENEGKNKKWRGKKGNPKKQDKGSKVKRSKPGNMINLSSLVNSNVYDESNRAGEKAFLPVVDQTRKKDFLLELIANIPIDDATQAKKDMKDVQKASVALQKYGCFPRGPNNTWTLKGMKTTLYHYQVQGASAMKVREIGVSAPYGGILADQMGLGKTVMSIATMVANRQVNPEEPKCTLIVCSSTLMHQWSQEIQKHADESVFKIIGKHHGGNRFNGVGAELQMQSADIVFTTYGEVVRSYPKCILPASLKTVQEKMIWWEKEWDKHRGLLHRAHFYRVIMDEAHVIKNYKSQTSIACRALMAKYRWAISGTPIMNRLDELFPYFKFLRVRNTGSMKTFRHNYCLSGTDICNQRLVSVLSGMMIRRSHATELMGAPLIQLPTNHQTTSELELNKVERFVYDRVRKKYAEVINRSLAQGTFSSDKRVIIIMFQRMRQMVAHIFMVQEVIQRIFDHDEIAAMNTDAYAIENGYSDSERAMISGLDRMISEADLTIEDNDAVRIFANSSQDAEQVTGSPPRNSPIRQPASLAEKAAAKSAKSAQTLVKRFGKFLRDIIAKKDYEGLRRRTLCQFCGDPPTEPRVTSCYHVYCNECLISLAMEAASKDMDQTECHVCGFMFTESAECDGMKELEIRDLSVTVFQHENNGGEATASRKKPFRLTMNYVDDTKDRLILSTKLMAVRDEIAASLTEDPDRKIIVFSEWQLTLHLVGRICQLQGWKCCHYNGRIAQQTRDQTVEAFDRDPSIKILVASLKCGGTGLNLTAASKVICIDLWFNSCVEQQAFCRVHRIGQKKETFITRIKMSNTVDERLIELQETKKHIIGAALDDRTIMKHLTDRELMNLFGTYHDDDGRGHPFIVVDDEAGFEGEKKKKRRKKRKEREGGEGIEDEG